MNYSKREIVKTKFVVYDKSPLLKKVVYDELAKDAGIEILDVFKDYKSTKDYLSKLNSIVDCIIINFLVDKDKSKDLFNIILELKAYATNLIIIDNIGVEKVESIQKTFGLSNIIFIDYFDCIDLKYIFELKDKITNEVYKIKNNRIKRALFVDHKAIVMAASTGGPKTLEYILGNLEKDINMPIFIVQHMVNGYTKQFAERLGGVCKYKVCEGRTGEIETENIVYIAPSGFHMEVCGYSKISLNAGKPVNSVKPSADILFSSAAKVYRRGLLGIVLTGMGRDAAKGIIDIKLNGGTTIAQSQISSIVFGMPKAAIETGKVDRVLSNDDIILEILKHAGKL